MPILTSRAAPALAAECDSAAHAAAILRDGAHAALLDLLAPASTGPARA